MSIIQPISDRWNAFSHNQAARAVLDTPPIAACEGGPVLFSMIGTKVLLPYLVAVKSLHAQLGAARVMLLDDGTLTATDKAILAEHCCDPHSFPIGAVDTGSCPTGSCWERLMTLLALRQDDYVIQLDSDTVTLGPVPEVVEAIAANRSFTLAGGAEEAELGALPIPEFTSTFYRRGDPSSHVQAQIEWNMPRFDDAADTRYIRGCAGFAGFAEGGADQAAAERFSAKAEALLGQRWTEWGSEQVASNYLVANDPGPVVLPYGRYLNYWNEPWGQDARFVHFIGTYRHANGAYRKATKAAIENLRG